MAFPTHNIPQQALVLFAAHEGTRCFSQLTGRNGNLSEYERQRIIQQLRRQITRAPLTQVNACNKKHHPPNPHQLMMVVVRCGRGFWCDVSTNVFFFPVW
eukprot:m.168486 g.168486  ORF g.168486 m.168486 type:complete len:100 (-) comp31520_c1_seq3:1179-1478(-)